MRWADVYVCMLADGVALRTRCPQGQADPRAAIAGGASGVTMARAGPHPRRARHSGQRARGTDRSGRKGDRLLRSYWSATARVTCDFTVTSVCDGKSECDGFGIAAMISVVYGSQRVQMRGYGGCGC